ncbi:MAG: carboxypeptidase regulatory-like domain-containing protein [Acidobacteriaceae bacterium]
MFLVLSRRVAQTLLLAATFGLTLNVAFAQGMNTGNISGTVADPTGAIIPGATITATADATHIVSTAKSGSDGNFSFKALPIGTYTVVIAENGFSPLTLNNVEVSSAKDEGLGVEKLNTGTAQSIVNVSAASTLLETSQSQVTTTFSAQQVSTLPLAGGFDEVALLIPGVVNTRSDMFSNSNGVGFSVNGERGRANNFEIDGQSNNDTTIAGPQFFFSNEEALAQVEVITDSFSAQYGRNAGSIINYITKSGSNAIHGSAIYKYSGDFSSSLAQGVSKGVQFGFCAPGQTPAADGCEAPVVPRYVNNYWGGTLGFPIIKDKLFAFGSTYWFKDREYGALVTSAGQEFPTPAGLTTLAAAFPNNPSVAIIQQLSPYSVTEGNPRQIGATVNETIDGITVPMSQFGRQIPSLASDQEDLGRIDWQATPKDHLFVRYLYQNNPDTPYQTVANGGFVNVSDSIQSGGAELTHTFGPRWINQLRYSFQQSTLGFEGGGFSNCTITSFVNCPSNVNPNGVELESGDIFTPLGLSSSFPQGRIVKVGQLQDNVIWTVGNHTITFGGEFDDTHAPNVFLPNVSGTLNFDTLDDFVAGGCSSGLCSDQVAEGSPTIPLVEYDAAAFLQDDWKATPNLTFNLGLRWEFFGQPLNGIHFSTKATQLGPNPLWSTALPLSETTAPYINNYYKNFEPRIGFAYNPSFNRRLVIRGAYAINVDPQFQNIVENVAQSAPAVISGSISCNGGTTNCIPTGGATFTTAQQQLAPQLPTGGNPFLDAVQTAPANFRYPVGQTYTLGMEYQIRNSAVLDVRYVGNHTSSQFQSLNANPYLAPVAAEFPNVVNPASLCTAADSTLAGGADIGYLHCGETSVLSVNNTAFSQYQSLQTNLTTHAYHGITATVAYTWSHNIDNADEVYSTGTGGNTISFAQNPLDTDNGERANSSLDFPNVASISFLYAFPKFHSGKTVLDRVMNGWNADTIWTYASGQNFTDYQGINNGSPVANNPGSGALGNANPGDPATTESYSDIPFESNFLGLDVARPILSNPKAPQGTLGIYTDTTTSVSAAGVPTYSAPVLEDFATGAVVSPSQVRFIANNQLAANILGNPYPGTSRHTLRGDTTNNADLTVFKDTKLTNRVTFRLEVDAFDVLNRAYYGTPGNYLADYASSGGSYFNNYFENTASGSQNLNTPGTGTRNLLFTGKILF